MTTGAVNSTLVAFPAPFPPLDSTCGLCGTVNSMRNAASRMRTINAQSRSGENTIAGQLKRYPSIGRCIYCGESNTRRGREHIVPLALLGHAIVFEDASCRDCAGWLETPIYHVVVGTV